VPAVKFDFMDRRSAERFAELLDESKGSRRHHTRGQADAELAELVAIGHSLSAARPGVPVDTEFRAGLRAMLVATAERDGIGATASRADIEPGAHAGIREPGRGLLRAGSARRIRVRGAIVISVAAGAMAVSGISAASESASPGDALYGVKRSTERAQLAMAGSDVTRGQLSLDFARTRLAEATSMEGGDPAFAAVLDDMDRDTRQGVKLLTSSAVARRSGTPLNTVDGFVTSQRGTFAPVLERLGADNRERAQKSLALLDTVHERTETLRTGLACDTVRPDGADSLGPTLAGCITGSGSTGSPGRSQGTGGKPATKPGKGQPERTDPAVAPGGPGPIAPDGSQPRVNGSVPASEDPAAGRSSAPADDEEGVLGGILGGILGN
jgi:hypothetical protein